MARRSPEFDLIAAIADPGFTPAGKDTPALLDLLAEAPADVRKLAERALRRLGPSVLGAAIERAKSGPSRARYLGLAGRLAGETGDAAADPAVRELLLEALRDPEPSVRKQAAAGLGRAVARDDAAVAALVDAASKEHDTPARTAMVEALGKLGGEAAEKALAALGAAPEHPGGASVLRKARVRAARPAARGEASVIDAERALAAPRRVWLDCRRGMVPVLLEEAAALRPRIEHRIDGSAIAAVDLAGPLATLFAARTWTSVALPGDVVRIGAGGAGGGAALAEAAARSIAGGRAREAAGALTRGPLRYRLAWASGGKRRAAVYAIAEAVAALDPALVNDPTDAPWEVVVREAGDRVVAEWVPALADPRFAYRRGDVPAASHPTIAAALAFLAGAKAGDVVWDPFVGSGLELCERALRGPYARLIGTDVEPAALEVARANLGACGAERFELHAHDAARGAPEGLRPTLVITNPPMGRRVHRSADLSGVLVRFVRDVARALVRGGRFVWVSPFPGATRDAGKAAGLAFRRGHVIDMGGFDAEIQVWTG